MPYRWTETSTDRRLRLWPHQSLTPEGFAWFVGATGVMLSLPVMAVLGSAVAWVLLVFFLATIWGVWRAIMANKSARDMHEELCLTTDTISLDHVPAKGATKSWAANPHWVTVHLRPKGPVENYLTLRGGGREVELGAFLTPEERQRLYEELQARNIAAS